MKRSRLAWNLSLVVLGVLMVGRAYAQTNVGTAFTYQGFLENGSGPVTATCDFRFGLWDAPAGGNQKGNSPQTVNPVGVENGVFTTPIDFGAGAADGTARWLAIEVQCPGDGGFTMLTPRVEMTPAPHALSLPGMYTQQNPTSPNVIGGFNSNEVSTGVFGATVGGGGQYAATNRVTDDFGTVGGGRGNQAGDGAGTTDDNPYATVGGGTANNASGRNSTIGGGADNTANAPSSTVAGGLVNTASGELATVGGGGWNTASGVGSTVGGGGAWNTASGGSSTIGGGSSNTASHSYSTVGGGVGNTASGYTSTVGGGYSNNAGYSDCTVGGGSLNTATGACSTIPGGCFNRSGGDYSFAAGRRGKVRDAATAGDADGDEGTFIWADATDADFQSTGPNQFLIRASGGVGIGTTTPAAQLDVNGAARTTTLEITGGTRLAQSVPAWGDNAYGQLIVPVGTFTAIAAGERHVLAIRTDGTLIGWGDNTYGEIDVPSGTFTVVAANSGPPYSLAIRDDGTLVGWGNNDYGQINVPPGTFTSVAAGGIHGVAIRNDGSLAGWGYNGSGQTSVPAGTFVAVAAGGAFSLAIRTDGALVGWGDNGNGAINVPAGTFRAIAAGDAHGLAIRSDGTLVGWGLNDNGQINVPSGTFTAIDGGLYHSLAIRDDGTLVSWGDNAYGQLNVPPGTFTTVVAGTFFSLAIRSDQSLQFGLLLANDSAAKPGSNTWTISSDRRLKKNIEPLSGALERLLQLRGVTFQWRDPSAQGGVTGTQMGLIADEVQRAFPQWVGRDPKGYQTLTVGGFEALTAEALRELRAEKDRQLNEKDCEIAELREQMGRLEAAINALTAKSAGGGR